MAGAARTAILVVVIEGHWFIEGGVFDGDFSVGRVFQNALKHITLVNRFGSILHTVRDRSCKHIDVAADQKNGRNQKDD